MSDNTTSPPPAYFLSLSLENVRSFGDKQTISFARPDGRPAQWTIILGDNGVGKTTVLKSLAALMPDTPYQMKDVTVPRIFFNWKYDWLPRRNSGEDRTLIKYSAQIGNLMSNEPLEVTEKYIREVSLEYPGSVFNKNYHEGSTEGMKLDMLGLVCYGYGAGRTVGNSTLGASKDVVEDTCISLFDDQADLLNPEEWFLQKTLSSYVNRGGAKRTLMELERVRRVLLQVLPNVTGVQIRSTDKDEQQLELETPYGWVRLRDMSLGYQTLVVWLTDFASKLFIRYPDSPNPLEEPAIVLIDEIDLHLHPSWQRKLIGFLSGIFKNTQFIATAHSPLVVQAAGDQGANVVLLRREGDQTVVVTDVEDVRGWRVDQILNSELFGDVSTLSTQTEEQLERRNTLLLKKRLTSAEKTELESLNAIVAAQPIGDTQPERQVESLLARLARNLKPEDLLE